MLTYPSDPLPQIVCPMDEDAIPPNRFCSAPPHSEPPPPLLSLSSITHSCANDGISVHRRSGRIQCIRAQTPKKQNITDSGERQKSSRQNLSPSKRQRESGSMIQESQSKQPKVESTHGHEKQKEGGFDFSLAAEHQNQQKDHTSPRIKTNVTVAENAFEHFGDNTTQNLDTTKSDMDACGGLAVGHTVDNAFAPKGWVIGPLFQSFKSKMASFTEIVMSPVKLFRANSPPLSMDHPDKLDGWELQADGTSDVEDFEPSDTFHPEAQRENGNQDAKANQQRPSEVQGAQNTKTIALKYSKKLSFDVELPTHSSEQEDERAITQKEKNSPDSVPLQHSPLPCIVSEEVSESIESVIRSSVDHPDKFDGWELQAKGTSDVEDFEPSDTFHPEAQRENGNQDAKANQQRPSEVQGAQNTKTIALKYSKKLSFDVELPTHSSEQEDELAITQKEKNSPHSVPLQHSPLPCIVSEEVSESIESVIRSSVLLQSSVDVSASHESKLKASSSMERQKGKLAARLKAPPRKCTGNRKKVTARTLTSKVKKEEFDPEIIEEQVSHMKEVKSNKADLINEKTLSLSSSVCYAQSDIVCRQPDGDDDGRKIESCCLVSQSLQNNLSDSANGRTPEPTLDTQQPECHLKPETSSAAVLGRAKRELKVDSHSQDFVKRKRLTADICTKDTKQELLNVASDGGVLRGLRPARKEVVSTNTSVDGDETLKPARKRQVVSTRANRKGKGGQEMLATINEAVLNTQTKSSSDVMLGCSPDKTSGVPENNQISSGSKVKPSSQCKRLKTRTGLGKPHVNIDNSMDLETTVAISSTKQPEQEPFSEVLVRPDTKQLQSTSKCRNINKKPLKRKLPNQASSSMETDSTLVSPSSALSMEPLELTPTDCNTSHHGQKEESGKMGLNQPSKRPNKGFRGAVKSSTSGGIQETKQCIHNLNLITKEKQSEEDKGKISTDPVYFEMTPFESNQQPGLSPSQAHVNCYVLLINDIKHAMDGKEKNTASVEDEVLPTDSEASNHSSIDVSRLRSSTRRVNVKPRRTDNQRRKCRVLHSRTRKGEEVTNSITVDDADLATRSSQNSRRLLRSYSCPEIPSLHPHDTTWTSLQPPDHSRIHTPHQHQSSHIPFDHHAQKCLRRARRHTVCSLEVEREIAPLCLRKEVYPSRRSVPYDGTTQNLSPSLTLSPSTSLSALASCFLSSPLAFLSKKVDSRGAAASTSSHVSSPTSSSSMYPLSPSTRRLPGVLQRTDSSSATLDSSSSGIPLVCEIARRQQSEEEDDGEDTSSSSQEFEDVGLREEKAFSDSEIKVVQKHEERGKVSSIRIRKTLPKPQNNLTPMGLPKPIRLKKKEFSLEEIYTNKNFSKPPESRLETIFEVPFNRRNGSESWFGQRRVKRFLEFLEVGEARKPKKPLVGVGKAGVSSSRTRRGGFPKDEPSLSVQDVDSLLCAKLEQLNLWLVHDQTDS